MKEELEIMDRVTERLSQLCMTYWLPVLHKWLAHYRGLCEFCVSEPHELPASHVLELLDSYKEPPTDVQLAHDLARLDFLCYGVGHLDQTDLWNPEVESLGEFMKCGPCTCWPTDTEKPPPKVTETKLLKALHDVCRKECGSQTRSH